MLHAACSEIPKLPTVDRCIPPPSLLCTSTLDDSIMWQWEAEKGIEDLNLSAVVLEGKVINGFDL